MKFLKIIKRKIENWYIVKYLKKFKKKDLNEKFWIKNNLKKILEKREIWKKKEKCFKKKLYKFLKVICLNDFKFNV